MAPFDLQVFVQYTPIPDADNPRHKKINDELEFLSEINSNITVNHDQLLKLEDPVEGGLIFMDVQVYQAIEY
jgi:hypothetical protein